MPHSVPERRGRLATAIRRWVPVHLAILATAYAAIWIVKEPNVAAVMELWFFAPIGVFGAIIANATGTGGGVVFVPAFNAIGGGAIQLQMDIAELIRITPDNTVGMSFVIQCFGMSIGTLVWLFFIVFGMLAITLPVQSAWVGDLGTADVFYTMGDDHVLSRALIRVSTFLGAFAAFYTTIYASSDPVYRASFTEDAGASLQKAVDVRRAYLTVKASGD